MDMIIKANENLKKAAELFKKSENAFNSMDLKLHNVSYYCYSDMKKDYPELEEEWEYVFDWFCEDEYNNMTEYFEEKGWDFNNRKQIGHTSQFYLDSNYRFEKREDMDDLLMNVVYTYGYNDIVPDIKDGEIDIEDEYLEDATSNIEFIASDEFIDDLSKGLEPIIGMYDYIKDFKDNQVDYFKEYLNNRRDILLYAKELQEKRDLEIWISGVEKIIA